MGIFGWIVLVTFAVIGFAVIVYALLDFAIVQVRIFNMKVSGELELMREDNKKTKELKRTRLESKRDAKHKMASQKLNARLSKLQKKTDESIAGAK